MANSFTGDRERRLGDGSSIAIPALRAEGVVQGIAAYSGMYLGFIGKFMVQIAIATTVSLLWCQTTSSWKRLIGLVLLAFVGIGVTLTDRSFASLTSASGSSPIAFVSPISVVSVIALIGTSALVTSIQTGNRKQFTIAQMLSLVTLVCICYLGIQTHGTFSFIAFTAMTLLGITGFVIAGTVKPGRLGAQIVAIAVLLVAMAGLFHANEQGLIEWFGFAPKLSIYCDSGIVPVSVAVVFSAGLAVAFRPRIQSMCDTELNHAYEGSELDPSIGSESLARPRW